MDQNTAQPPYKKQWYLIYYGMSYDGGGFDCSNLVELIYKNELGIPLILPQHQDFHFPDCNIDKYSKDAGFVLVDEPQEFDVVLMRKMGKLHFGVLFFNALNVQCVVHNQKGCGVIAERIINVNVIGFYRCEQNFQQTL